MALDISGFKRAAADITQAGLVQSQERPLSNAFRAGLNVFNTQKEQKRKRDVLALQEKIAGFQEQNAQAKLNLEKQKIEKERIDEEGEILRTQIENLPKGHPQRKVLFAKANSLMNNILSQEAFEADEEGAVEASKEIGKLQKELDTTKLSPTERKGKERALGTLQRNFAIKYGSPETRETIILQEAQGDVEKARLIKEGLQQDIKAPGQITREERGEELDLAEKERAADPARLKRKEEIEKLDVREAKAKVQKLENELKENKSPTSDKFEEWVDARTQAGLSTTSADIEGYFRKGGKSLQSKFNEFKATFMKEIGREPNAEEVRKWLVNDPFGVFNTPIKATGTKTKKLDLSQFIIK